MALTPQESKELAYMMRDAYQSTRPVGASIWDCISEQIQQNYFIIPKPEECKSDVTPSKALDVITDAFQGITKDIRYFVLGGATGEEAND